MDTTEIIIKILRKMDIDSLAKEAGRTVVKAVSSVFQTNVERELAEVVFLRYGCSLLKEKGIRKAVIDILTSKEIARLCDAIGISCPSKIAGHKKVQKYFDSYTPEKSKILADFLGLDSKFYLHPIYDDRNDMESLKVGYDEILTVKPFLHPYQKCVKDKILQNLGGERERFIVQMPTGAGKTYTALEAVVDVLRMPWQNKFVVWVVDSNELCEQALNSFANLWKAKGDSPIDIFRLFGDFDPNLLNHSCGVVFVGFDKLDSIINNPDHKLYRSTWHLINNTTLVVVDEAHASIAETRENCVNSFINSSSANIVGLTATPARVDPEETEALSRLYSGKLIPLVSKEGSEITDPVGYLQENGYLARINGEIIETYTESNEKEEGRLLQLLSESDERNARLMEQIVLAHQAEEPTLVFACTKEHVFALRVLCKAKGIPVEHITGEVHQAERLDILSRFKRGEFFVLLNLDILSTGIDVPNVKKLIITRPIASRIQYSQVIGRALRGPKNGGNATNTVVNIKDNLINFPEANTLYEWFARDYLM